MSIKLSRTLTPHNINCTYSVTLNIILSSVNSNLCFNPACQKLKDFLLCLVNQSLLYFWAFHLEKKFLKVCKL